MLPAHITQIQKPTDLVTSIETTRDGFISQAKEKILRAKPYVDEAIEFKDALLNATHLTSVLAMHEFRPQLIAAAGFSAKSLNNRL